MIGLKYRPPKKLKNRYEIQDYLGVGSFGDVYKARDLLLERDVAIKYLIASPDIPLSMRELAVAEARHLVQLEHPNIVRIYDLDRDGTGRWFLVNNLIDGTDLQEIFWQLTPRGERLKVQACIAILDQLLSALVFVHERGVLHRDIKPANLIWNGAHLTVIDFGIAITTAGHQRQLYGGQGQGTYGYQHPRARRGNEDALTDLFSIGIVAYQALTGVHPFLDPMLVFEDRMHLMTHPSYMPVPAHARNTEVPEAVSEVVSRLIRRGPLQSCLTQLGLEASESKQVDRDLPVFEGAKDALTALRESHQ